MALLGMEEMAEQIRSVMSQMGAPRLKKRRVRIAEAMRLLTEEEAQKLLNEEDIRAEAVRNLEQNGIVFIDEIDKVASRGEGGGTADVSRQGVQRDLLPLVEGATVSTKYGMVKTDHILFIASGAFHLAKPSDLIPELQTSTGSKARSPAAACGATPSNASATPFWKNRPKWPKWKKARRFPLKN